MWGNHTLASAYSVIFLGILVALIFFYQRATRQMYRYTTISEKGYRPKLMAIGRWKFPALAMIAFFYLVTGGLPLLVLIASSFFSDWRAQGLAALAQPSLDSFRSALGNAVFLDSLKHTAFITS